MSMGQAKAMNTEWDPRQRGQVKVDALRGAIPNPSSRIQVYHLLGLLLTKTLVASSAWLTRQWLLVPQFDLETFQLQMHDMLGSDSLISSQATKAATRLAVHSPASVWAVATMASSLAAVILILVFRIWNWKIVLNAQILRDLAVLAAMQFAQLILWLVALRHLGATNVLIFTQFCEVWVRDLRVGWSNKSSGSTPVLFALGLTFMVAAISGSAVSIRHPFGDVLDESAMQALHITSRLQDSIAIYDLCKGYLALVVYAMLSVESSRAALVASRKTGGRRRAIILAIVLVASIMLPCSCIGAVLGYNMLPAPLVPGRKLTPQDAFEISHLVAYWVLAVSLLICDTLVSLTLDSYVHLYSHAAHAWPMAVIAAFAIGFGVFSINVGWSQLIAALCVGFALHMVLKRSPLYLTSWYRSRAFDATLEEQRMAMQVDGADTTPVSEAMRLGYRAAVQLRWMIKAILAKNDSRRIFLFLCLNLAFMGVQMLWGVWTNSLGLISDAIHMFFDCAAIFMGLIASVMAAWKTDDQFHFGYKRVETLSGFANGIFLVLISVFILFEAVQRIIEPPVMNNMTQLLIVSSLGLLVNLFGMFAMGHHHHGHSHGHDHGHSCSHGDDHSHHHHDHGHSHNMLGLYLHVMADTLGSVGVIISTLLIYYFHWTGFDPIASLLIGLMILGSVVPLVIDCGRILCLDLTSTDTGAIEHALSILTELPGVADFSAVRFWPLDGGSLVGSIHIQAKSDTHGEQDAIHHTTAVLDVSTLALQVEKLLKNAVPGLESITVQVDRAEST
ncbi:Putative zinc transporter msc2 [Malassezia yamatoensis]|uniref:Zinc transporter msc2 n=1 Tax=Malassezia yamatoensis TaxID=253288 RepID=A0AAJ5YS93_9BASI|nr:Putative zinc transporter msc2 [Malassezia yamatoensis]